MPPFRHAHSREPGRESACSGRSTSPRKARAQKRLATIRQLIDSDNHRRKISKPVQSNIRRSNRAGASSAPLSNRSLLSNERILPRTSRSTQPLCISPALSVLRRNSSRGAITVSKRFSLPSRWSSPISISGKVIEARDLPGGVEVGSEESRRRPLKGHLNCWSG